MIELTDWLKAELARRAEAEAPLEACGFVSREKEGRGGQPPKIGLWAAENASQEPETSFLIAPTEQTSILKQVWGRGEELVGVYHSHPRSAPEPSARDRAIAGAHVVPLTWVIVGQCLLCGGSGDADTYVDYEDYPETVCANCEASGYEFWVGDLP